MSAHPLRLIVCGYGLAFAASALLVLTGGGLLGAGLVFWLGGAAAAIGLALIPGVSHLFRAPVVPPAGNDESAYAAALEAWEADWIADREAAATARASDVVSGTESRVG